MIFLVVGYFAWLIHGPAWGGLPTVAPAEPRTATDQTALADLCRGSQLCRQVVMFRNSGALLLRVTFVHPERFVDEGDEYCDAREYWYVKGQERRLLVARDCAEQWGADNQGPIDVSFDGKQVSLEYIEWQSSDGCERMTATFDWKTTKIASVKKWVGQATNRRRQCTRQKTVKADAIQGPGTVHDPLITFHPK